MMELHERLLARNGFNTHYWTGGKTAAMKGPSVTVNFPLSRRRRMPCDWSAPVVTSTPDCIASPMNFPISAINSGVGGGADSGLKLGS